MPIISPIYLRWVLLLTTLLLIAGFVTPMLTITKLVFFDHSFSILSGIGQLWRDQQFFLFIVIGCFSVVLPLAKILVLFNLLSPNSHHPEYRKRLLHLMHDYGRWAMLDVMVVALLIMSVKLGAIASIHIHAGLYIFSAAVILIMLITQQVVKHAE
ncbi:paraquat-inducible membrane protein A [Methylophaga sp. 42_25_T18]|nr:paraquat-inducible membrane protein A [Methylophaga sp. 42_25_T18]OUR85749.1 paraquat-inducible membrane protein A [Methylophaga sp. 42_8_T64]